LRNTNRNPIVEKRNKIYSELVSEKFGDEYKGYLSLYKYINVSPYKFYDKSLSDEIQQYILDFCRNNEANFNEYLISNKRELNYSIKNLEEINQLDFHDSPWIEGDIKTLIFIDKVLHQAYLKLVEGTYKHLLKLLAFISRKRRGSSINRLDIFNSVEELRNLSSLNCEIPYKNIMRNGIAHGDYTYFDNLIEYRDKKGNIEKITPRNVIREFDAILDKCNSIMLALKLIMLPENYSCFLPEYLYEEELKMKVELEGWKIINMFYSTVENNLKQLNIHILNDNYYYNNVHLNAVYTALNAELYFNPLHRVYLSLDSSSSKFIGFGRFSGTAIKALRENDYTFTKGMETILEEKLLFFVPRFKFPKFLFRIGDYRTAIRHEYQNRSIIKDSKIGFKVRYIRFHSQRNYNLITQATVIISEEKAEEFIKENVELIIKSVLKKRNNKLKIFSIDRLKPTKCIKIWFFKKDSRKRVMNKNSRSGLIGSLHFNDKDKIESHLPIGIQESVGKYTLIWKKQNVQNNA